MNPRFIPIIVGITKVVLAAIVFIVFDNVIARLFSVLLALWATVSFKIGFKASDKDIKQLVNDPDISLKTSNNIFRKYTIDEIEHKQKTNTSEVGDLFFNKANSLSKYIINEDKDALKLLGIKNVDKESLVEFTIFNLYANKVAVEKSLLSKKLKKLIVKKMIYAFVKWLEKDASNNETKCEYEEMLMQRFEIFDEVNKIVERIKIEKEANPGVGEILMLQAEGKFLLMYQVNLLPSPVSIRDYNHLPFLNIFNGNLKQSIQMISEYTDKMNIIV